MEAERRHDERRRDLRVVETKLAGVTVRDDSQLVDTCSACGEGFFPALMRMGCEVRAVMTVLVDAPERADGAVLRYARHVLGLKQDELAKLLGLTVTTIVRMKKAKTIEARVRTSMLSYLRRAGDERSGRALCERHSTFASDHRAQHLASDAPRPSSTSPARRGHLGRPASSEPTSC